MHRWKKRRENNNLGLPIFKLEVSNHQSLVILTCFNNVHISSEIAARSIVFLTGKYEHGDTNHRLSKRFSTM